jgi:hypothetical protein
MNARQTLAALQELPGPVLHDIDTRIEKARKRLRIPPGFSEATLTEIAGDLTKLRKDVLGEESGPDADGPPQSPVEDY